MKISTCNPCPVFEKNLGQLPKNIKYKVNANGYTTLFCEDKLIVSLPSNKENTRNVFYMKLENKNSYVKIKGQEKQIGKINYLIGNDESKWITNIPTYSKVKYEEVYKDIDLYYYINNYNLEYDFVLQKYANPNDICMRFEGVDNIEIDDNENIVLSIGDVKAQLLRPEVYQIIDGIKINVDCEYKIDENNFVSFLVDEYEKEYELVLDPVLKLDYSTYIGGSVSDGGYGIAVDEEGCVYITGSTSGGYPITSGAYQIIHGGYSDVFISKISPDGSGLMYSTYIGGSNSEYGESIEVDKEGSAYITGYTDSSDFPTTLGAYQTNYSGNTDAFIIKMSKDGSELMYSTYIGGSSNDKGYSIAIDEERCVYITGSAGYGFPTTLGAYQTNHLGYSDAFISKLSQDGSELMYSTYIGGSSAEEGYSIAVDKDRCAYITGYTFSNNFPTTSGVYQTTNGGGYDIFVSKISQDGSELIYSTYIGGSDYEEGRGIVVDEEGCVYITGQTRSSDYPTTSGVYQTTNRGGYDVLVSKLSSEGSELIYSTYIGGSNGDFGQGIEVDKKGNAYVTGFTYSSDYPTISGAYQIDKGGVGKGLFISKISQDGSELIYSAYIGGISDDDGQSIEVDAEGSAYITGYTRSSNFPTTSGAYQTTFGGYRDVFVTKISQVEFDLTWNYNPLKAKLLDNITTNLNVTNPSQINLDINIKYQALDESVEFIPNSLYIQNIHQDNTLIPSQIYLSNIPPNENVEIRLDLEYIKEKYPQKIPIEVTVELYDPRITGDNLAESITKTFYMNTNVGPNYIPGCYNLYTLEIDGKLQTTPSGIPIIYYKSGSSYIYIEPSIDKYQYKVLSNPSNVVEHQIKKI